MAVPHNEYIPLVEAFGKKGIKNILKEKPVACSLTEFYQLRAIEKLYNMRIGIASQRRYSKGIKKMKEHIRECGCPVDFSYKYYLGLGKNDFDLTDWRENKSLSGGGALIDMGYHAVDIIGYLFGNPNNVSGYLRKPTKDSSIESGAIINLDFTNTTGTISVERFLSPSVEEICLHWRDFSIKLVDGVLYKITNLVNEVIAEDNSSQMLKDQLNDFVSFVNGNDNSICTILKTINTIEIIEKCYLNCKWKTDTNFY